MKIGFCFDDKNGYRRECICLYEESDSEFGKYKCQYVSPVNDEVNVANFQCFEEATPDELPTLKKIVEDYARVTGII